MAPTKPPAFSWEAHDGPPAAPTLPAGDRVLVRYIFDGGKLSRDARLATFEPRNAPSAAQADGCRTVLVAADEVIGALAAEGVDLSGFYATAWEEAETGGAWVRLLPEEGQTAAGSSALTFTLSLPPVDPSPTAAPRKRPRLDVKLCKRPQTGRREALEHFGYFAVGIVGGKSVGNVGSLWRSAFQMGTLCACTLSRNHAPAYYHPISPALLLRLYVAYLSVASLSWNTAVYMEF